jgi:RNA polymerase sigma-70 factor (ECF subfamily)
MRENTLAAGACEESPDAALSRLAQTVAPRGFRLACHLLGDAAEAQDAVQEALLRACAGHHRLADPGALEGWFFRVLTNHCRRQLRRRRLRQTLARLFAPGTAEALRDPAPLADEALDRCGRLARLLGALAALPSMQRVVLVLRYEHGAGVAEIAGLLGIKPATVKTHLVRGLERLREHMESNRCGPTRSIAMSCRRRWPRRPTSSAAPWRCPGGRLCRRASRRPS